MSRATPQMRKLAARLIATEGRGHQRLEIDPPLAFNVCEKLRPHLATLMGEAGFRAVLSRALAVATEEVPSLVAVQLDADGSIERWQGSEAPMNAKEMAQGGVLVVAQLLGLLVAFIGDNLTMRLVREVWPKVAVEELHFTQKDHP
jgi:hypothetical protein